MKASIDSDVINFYQKEENVVYYYYYPNHNEESLLKLFRDKKLADKICVDNTTYNADAVIITYDDDGRCRCYHVPRTKS